MPNIRSGHNFFCPKAGAAGHATMVKSEIPLSDALVNGSTAGRSLVEQNSVDHVEKGRMPDNERYFLQRPEL
ncbi:hypothetical protein ACFFRP_18950 [Pseudarthrobacter oxydans]